MAYTIEDYVNERLEKDPVFNKEWESNETERLMNVSLIRARLNANMSQKQLSEETGINQSNLSRIESGNGNPSVSTLKRIADALGVSLKIEFVPKVTK